MEATRVLKFLVTIVVLAIAGCKAAVINIEGGLVETLSRSMSCPAGDVCIVEITDHRFDETFLAKPDPGWEFVRWNSGGNFLCPNSTERSCRVSSVGTEGNQLAEAVIASDEVYYLMPVFRYAATNPITETLTVDGVEWAQPDLFTDLSWGEIDLVCPGGTCSGGLNGWDMNGWTFATAADVGALFNFYIGSNYFGATPNAWTGDSDGIPMAAFIEAGWRFTNILGVSGRLRDAGSPGTHLAGVSADNLPLPGGAVVDVFANNGEADDAGSPTIGAWFYRVP